MKVLEGDALPRLRGDAPLVPAVGQLHEQLQHALDRHPVGGQELAAHVADRVREELAVAEDPRPGLAQLRDVRIHVGRRGQPELLESGLAAAAAVTIPAMPEIRC